MRPAPDQVLRHQPEAHQVVLRNVASIVLVAAFVAGCSSSGRGPASSSARAAVGHPTSVRLATSFAIENLDPVQNGFWGSEFGFGDLLMKPLGNGNLQPWLLQSLTRTGPTTWMLTLRPGEKFQNGDVLDGAALAASMNYMLTNNTSLEPVLPGAKATVISVLTVELTTAQPSASVPSLMANEAMFDIFDTPIYLKLKHDPAALVGARIYTGPYVVTSLTPQQMVMAPNRYYYGTKPVLQSLIVPFIPDAQARIDAVEHGEVDLALYPPTAAARQLQGRTDAYFLPQPRGYDNDDFELVMNVRSGPLADVAVRQAIQHGIDYQQIARQVLNGYYDAPTGLYPPSLPYALHDQRTDAAVAERELQDAGWVRGAKGMRTKQGQALSFTLLTYPQQPDTAPIALAIQAQLKPLGIDMAIRQVSDVSTMLNQPTGWDAALDGDTAMDWTDSDPIEPLLSKFATTGDANYGGISNARIDQIGQQLEASQDQGQTAALLDEAQRIIVEQQAYLIVVTYKRDPVVASPAFRSYVVPHAALLWTDAYA